MHSLSRLLLVLALALLLGPVAGPLRSPGAAAAGRVSGAASPHLLAPSGDLSPAPAREGEWPLQPRPEIASGFDPPATRWGAGHRGVDLRGRAGQRVHASLGGTVTFAAPLAGRGVVVVDHGGVRTTYEPVEAAVRVGQRVGRGAVLGRLQRARSHCFPRSCLHWGLRRGADYLDPLTLVGAGPLRLLPWDASPGALLVSGTSGDGGMAAATAIRRNFAAAPAVTCLAPPVGQAPSGRYARGCASR